jgi:hypothetical protein
MRLRLDTAGIFTQFLKNTLDTPSKAADISVVSNLWHCRGRVVAAGD